METAAEARLVMRRWNGDDDDDDEDDDDYDDGDKHAGCDDDDV